MMKKRRKTAIANRIGMMDEVRGLAIILMVLYHAGFDLVFLYGISIPFFTTPQMDFLRDFFAGLFIFISGAACRLSHNNLKRGIICFLFGMALTLFTWLFAPSEIILFGILHMLGLSMILFYLLRPLLDKIKFPIVGFLVCALLYGFTAGISSGHLGPLSLPDSLYQISWLFPIGITAPGFFSSDYFPLLPWIFVFFAGSYFGIYLKEHRVPKFIYKTHIKPLAFVGRHTLWIYLLHQPVLYGVFALFFTIVPR